MRGCRYGARGCCRRLGRRRCSSEMDRPPHPSRRDVDLPGRVVRAARAAGPGGLTGPLPSCGSRRLLEQQCREPPAWRAQQEHRRQPEQQPGFSRFEHAPEPEPARSRPRRASVGASRAGHDEPAPLVESGGVTAGARPGPRGRRAPAAVFCGGGPSDGLWLLRFFQPSHNPRFGGMAGSRGVLSGAGRPEVLLLLAGPAVLALPGSDNGDSVNHGLPAGTVRFRPRERPRGCR